MKKMTQFDIILNHLQQRGHINSIEAIRRYGITRISAVIYKLRNAGYVITSTVDNPMAPLFATYRLDREATKKQRLVNVAHDAISAIRKSVNQPETIPTVITDFAVKANREANSINR